MLRLFMALGLLLSIAAAVLVAWAHQLPAAMHPDRDAPRSYLITNASLLDPATDRVQADGHVLVVDGRIERVGTGALPARPDGVELIDAGGRVLMPGLVDVHVHVFDETDLAAGLARGVTTVRNMGGFPFHLPLASRIERGEILGPRLMTTGPILNEVGGRNGNALHEAVDGAEEARASVRRQYAAGFRHLKLYSNLSRESFAAIRDEATGLGMTMSGHPVEGTEADPVDFAASLDAGFRTLEHTESIVWYALNDEMDPAGVRRLAEQIAASGTMIDPTLVVHENLARIVETGGAHITRPVMASYNPVIAGFEQDNFEFWAQYPHDDRTRMQAFYVEFTGALHEAGVPLTVGTDSGVMVTPHGVSTVREMEILVDAGLTPMEAIRAATLNGAQALGLEGEVGCLAPGCAADLILLNGDPAQDIARLYEIEAVMRDGRWLDRDALAALEEAGHHPSTLRTWWRLGQHTRAIG
ncbi:amidohydrolase family protein [Maricaulis maris]|uniref:Imidazolonepropionase-like amidohydrolase n=1 Tax=Maricaulis maris TaxID=74318 RepID=A0A495CYA3_9PROT|nr:amidohydrolase family protein [Maricaulis maris]RKQ94237.1 imidazolonepropionase-like amidohydrolase [Maricaulis maris]